MHRNKPFGEGSLAAENILRLRRGFIWFCLVNLAEQQSSPFFYFYCEKGTTFMKTKRFISILLAFCLLLGFGFAVQAEEAPAPAGYIAIMVDANVLGAGVLYGPAMVRIYEGDTLMDATQRFLGENAVGTGWISGIVLPHNITVSVPEAVAKALTEIDTTFPAAGATLAGETLGAGDFAAWAGWNFSYNNTQPVDEDTGFGLTADDVLLENGDVVRWEFTLRAGICIGFESPWGDAAFFEGRADKGELITAAAQVSVVSAEAMAVLGNLLATQADVDAAVEAVAITPPPCCGPWWSRCPCWIQWILRWIFFGWWWMA